MLVSVEKQLIPRPSEGLINRNSKLKIRNARRGYTLVEMAVVMTIITVIVLVGVSSFLAARDQGMLNDSAERLKADIRRIQIKAISVEGDCGSNIKPKMWAITLTDRGFFGYYISYYCTGPVAGWRASNDPNDRVVLPAGFSLSGWDNANRGLSIIFNAPFGRIYQWEDDVTYPPASWPPARVDDLNVGSYCPGSSGCSAVNSNRSFLVEYKGRSMNVNFNGSTGATEVR